MIAQPLSLLDFICLLKLYLFIEILSVTFPGLHMYLWVNIKNAEHHRD